ncbi:heterokaryon incompatibility domain-containing protein [Trichoderma velutinum]
MKTRSFLYLHHVFHYCQRLGLIGLLLHLSHIAYHKKLAMGYTHYYTIHDWNAPEWQRIWPTLTKEVPMILEAADVLVRGPWSELSLVTPPLIDATKGIWFDGMWDDGHDPFRLSRNEKGPCFFKTARKSYDIVVTCTLLRAYLLAPSIVELGSDGDWDKDWMPARRLYADLWPGEPCWCPWYDDTEHLAFIKNADFLATTHLKITQAENVTSHHLQPQNQDLLPSSVRPVISETCLNNVRRWLAHCEEDAAHSKCQPSNLQWSAFPGVQFKVIDVFRRRITLIPKKCQYIALSYVWGAVNQPKLTADMLSKLTEDGGLDIIWANMPQTVKDAVIFCESIGERYLWVDALCIIQDSPRDMRLSILRMRQIYAAAKCTISATSASTAETGILNNLALDNWRCLTIESQYKLIEMSPWSQRAWCYQEKVLSHRMIFFTANGAYMQCQSGVYNGMGECLAGEIGQPGPDRYNVVGGMLSMHIQPSEELESYLSAVEYYSTRTATKRTDKMNAFQGIMHLYSGTMNTVASTFCFGLPTFAFGQTFCWRSQQHNPGARNSAFPSWSWLGWDSPTIFDREIVRKAQTDQLFTDFDIEKSLRTYSRRAGPGFREVTEIRKPARLKTMHEFGFAAASAPFFHGRSFLRLIASIGKLNISNSSQETDGLNGLYAVFPNIYCDQSAKHTVDPLGSIWLQTQWREQQGTSCTMDFMALTGHIDVNKPGKWTITMLMCLRDMDRDNPSYTYERLQIMDCALTEEEWLGIGATTRHLNLQ